MEKSTNKCISGKTYLLGLMWLTLSLFLTYNINAQVSIKTEPSNKTVCAGATATFSVVATGTIAGYQWFKNGSPIAGATGSSYTTPPTTSSNNGDGYEVEVDCSCGAPEMSNVAVLTVNSPAKITSGSSLVEGACEGESVTLSVTADNATGYQWKKNGVNIKGAVGANLVLSNVQTSSAGSYTVEAFGTCGNDSYGPIVLTVSSKPVITLQPVGATKCEGETVTLKVSATNAGSYQWFQNGGALADGNGGRGSTLSGATSSSLTITNLCATCNPGSYTVMVNGSGECASEGVTSNVAVLVVNTSAKITSGSSLVEGACEGESVTLSVTADNATGYQWKKNGVNITGAVGASLELPNVQTSSAGSYTVEAFGTCGNGSYGPIVLTVSSKPVITLQPVGATKCEGETVTLSVSATNAGSYQWFQNGGALADGNGGGGSTLSGATSSSLTITNLCATCNPGSYTVMVNGSGECASEGVTSNVAVLVVNTFAKITSGSSLVEGSCEGESVTLSVTADNATGYQWKKNGVNITGAVGANLVLSNVQTSSAGSYTVEAFGTCGNDSYGPIALTVSSKPVITLQPVGATKCEGESHLLSVTATNTAGYQWQKNNVDITGATGSTYSLSNVSLNDAGLYRVVIKGQGGCATQSLASANAEVKVNQPITITTQPASTTVCEGSSVTFTVASTGTVSSYQWYRNDVVLAGATSSSYNVLAFSSNNGDKYKVMILGPCGNVQSSEATLTVNLKPVITTSPANATKCIGEGHSFSVVATNVGTYQWQKNGVNIAGATGLSYLLPTLTAADAGLYSVVIKGAGTCTSETVVSANAVLNLNTPITITAQPASTTVCEGSSVTFTVASTGTVSSYQWYRNDVVLAGATSSSYNVLAFSSNNGDKYKVMILDPCGNVQSSEATLTVNLKPVITTSPANATKCIGEGHSFSVVATNVGTYQWQKNGVNIAGATGSGYFIPTLTAADAGLYSVVIKGAGTCTSETVVSANAVLNLNTPVSITTQPQSQTICNSSDVIFTVQASGTITGYRWYRNGNLIAGATSATYGFTTSALNNFDKYRVEVLGICGDVSSSEATLTINTPLVPTISTNKPNGMCEGEQSVLTAVGCLPNDKVQWFNDGLPIATGFTFTTNRTSTFTAKCESNGCLSVVSSNAIQPVQLSSVGYTAAKQNITCFEGKDGSIEIVPSGSAGGPYAISWQSPTSFDFRLTSLPTATYSFTLTDRLGCKKTFTETLTQPSKPTGTVESTDITCFGAANGRVVLKATSDYAGFKYILNSNPATNFSSGDSHIFNTLTKGTYSVRVLDAKNCEVIPTTSVTIREPEELVLKTISTKNPRGATTKDGTILVGISGGTAPYNTIYWSTSQGIFIPSTSDANTTQIGPVDGGEYRLRVVDKNGCEKNTVAAIIAPAAITVAGKVDSVSCFSKTDGKIEATISGGVKISTNQPYTTVWRKLNANGGGTEIAKNTTLVSGLAPGEYELLIVDSNAISLTQKYILIEPALLKSSVIKTVPNYCQTTPLGEVTLAIEGGRIPYSIKWDKTAATTAAVKGLTSGVHTATITDKSGCVTTATATVADSSTSFKVSVTYQQPTCFGRCDGRLKAVVTGGTAPYQYSWGNLLDRTSEILTVCGQTTTTAEIRDAKGCIIKSSTVELIVPAPRALGLGTEQEVCPSKPFELSASTVSWGNSFTWTLPNGRTKSGAIIQGDTVGVYKITVLDANMCGGTQTISVVPNKNVTPLFTIASTVPVNKDVIAVDFSSPTPTQIQWVYPSSVVLVSQDSQKTKFRFTRTGVFSIRELVTVNDCVYPKVKSVEVVESIDNGGFLPALGAVPEFDFIILGNPAANGRIKMKMSNESEEPFLLFVTPINGSLPVVEKVITDGSQKIIEVVIPSSTTESMFIVTAVKGSKMVSKKVLIVK